MQRSSRALNVLLFLVLVSLVASGQDGDVSTDATESIRGSDPIPVTGTAALFINTAPIRAEVVIDGTPVGATPVLVRDLRAGMHVLSIQKPGYVTIDEELTLQDGEVAVFTHRLEGSEFVASFSTEAVVNGQRYERADSRFVLPTGTYQLSADGASMVIEAVYPLESAFRTLLYLAPALGVISIGATLEDVWLRDKSTSTPTPATFASWTATTAATGMLVALAVDRRRFFEQTTIDEYSSTLTAAEAEALFRSGEAALTAGNLASALADYARVVAEGADSEFVPGALYKTARIYQLSDDAELALPAFQLLIRSYPDPVYYDAALKAIADIHEAAGEYDQALQALDRMLIFDDELFPREEIEQYADEIRGYQAQGSAGGDE